MSEKIDKEELKAPDAFVSTTEKFFKWIEDHFQLIGMLLGAVLVVSLSWIGFNYYESKKEQQAADLIYAAEAELRVAETRVRDERAKKLESLAGGKKAAKSAEIRPPDYKTDFAPAVVKIKTQIQAHQKTKAALISALNLSYFLMQQEQYPEALAVLDLPTYKPSANDVLNGFWLMHRGLTYLENEKPDEAIAAYESVVKATGLKAFHPEALLKLGVAFELKGNPAKARESYERLTREFPKTEASSSAHQYLRLLDLNQSQQG